MRRHVGVALGADRLTAAAPARAAPGEPWTRPLEPHPGGTGWRDLADALAELREATRAAAVHVALLPPLAQVRRIELPRLSDDELRAVLVRDAGRYLLDPPVPPIVAAWPGRSRRRSPAATLAAFADADLVASIHSAAAEAGFRSARVVSAHAAWEAAARREFPATGRGRACLVIAGEHTHEALVLESGRLDLCRRFPATDDPATIVARLVEDHSLDDAAAWAVSGSAADRARFESALRAVQVTPTAKSPAPVGARGAPAAPAGASGAPAVLAASGAPAARAELLPDPIRLARARRERRLSTRLVTATAAMLLLSAALELWGAHRALRQVQSDRAAIRPLVAQAMDIRQEVEGVQDRLRALAAAESGASRWTAVIADVADHLPKDAYLLSLRGASDSLVLEGVAQRAAGVFESLRDAPRVVAVRAEAPIRQESQDSAAPVERFILGARLAAVRDTAEAAQ
jgi:hypothetical protein